ncbi:MAG: hypothetical protein ABIN20_06460 [candidate division WOR-3 bacterium]
MGNLIKKFLGLMLIFTFFFIILNAGSTKGKEKENQILAIPLNLSYQGYLTDASGNPINGTKTMNFAIYDAQTGGTQLWSSGNQNVNVSQGIFEFILTNVPANVFTPGAPRWLQITVESEVLSPRTPITSAPWAYATLYSEDAGKIAGRPVSSNAPSVGQVLKWSGTEWVPSNDETGTGYWKLTQNLLTPSDSTWNIKLGRSFTNLPPSKLYVKTKNLYGGYFYTDSLNASSHAVHAVYGGSGNYDAKAVYGASVPAPAYGYGGYFLGGWTGVYGASLISGSGSRYGVWGEAANGSVNNYGVRGVAYGTTGTKYGVYGSAGDNGTNYGVYGYAPGADGDDYGVFGYAGEGLGLDYAGYFSGDVRVTGTLYKGGGGFLIDHPLDPENKYLYHSFVESPEMKNVYDGIVKLDEKGEAWVELPEWFEALNKDFRYQLTCIGDYAPVYIAEKIKNNRFKIAGGKPGMEVCWQVTGIRKDPFAEKYRIPVEEWKREKDIGYYLHPEAYGLPKERGIDYKNHIKPLLEKER